jgi:hypothetical protein
MQAFRHFVAHRADRHCELGRSAEKVQDSTLQTVIWISLNLVAAALRRFLSTA